MKLKNNFGNVIQPGSEGRSTKWVNKILAWEMIIFEYVAWTGHPDTGPTQHDPPTQQILDSTYKIKELCVWYLGFRLDKE